MALWSTVVEALLIIGKFARSDISGSLSLFLSLELDKISVLETIFQGIYQDLKDLRGKLYLASQT